jgi:ABC-type sulfate/molybdate transport systems ATPase subunit
MSSALEMCGVAKRYVAGISGCIATVNVLRAVDLMLRPGDTVAVVGPTGSGKSTLLLVAAGLLVPDAGEIRWFGDASRGAAMRHAVYHFPGVRTPPNAPTGSRVHLVDDPDALAGPDAARLSRWITRRTTALESVLIATRSRATALSLASRVFVLVGGVLHTDVVATAPRVAEATRTIAPLARHARAEARDAQSHRPPVIE